MIDADELTDRWKDLRSRAAASLGDPDGDPGMRGFWWSQWHRANNALSERGLGQVVDASGGVP